MQDLKFYRIWIFLCISDIQKPQTQPLRDFPDAYSLLEPKNLQDGAVIRSIPYSPDPFTEARNDASMLKIQPYRIDPIFPHVQLADRLPLAPHAGGSRQVPAAVAGVGPPADGCGGGGGGAPAAALLTGGAAATGAGGLAVGT